MSTTTRLATLRRVAADLGITLVRHPERDLAPLYARDYERFYAALAADADKERAKLAAEWAIEDRLSPIVDADDLPTSYT